MGSIQKDTPKKKPIMKKEMPENLKNGVKNLKPFRDSETAKASGKRGGIKSGEVKREKKRMSELYADFLSGTYSVEKDEQLVKLTGEQLVNETIKRVFCKGDSSSVSMMKEIREATEGNKLAITGENGKPVQFAFVDPPERPDADK